MLVWCGTAVERILGPAGLVVLYLVGAYAAAAAQWALDPGGARRYGADEAFPLSDHADYPSLLAYAKATGAQEVVCVHGFAEELAQALQAEGIDARKVGTLQQLDLFNAPKPRARTGS